MRNLSLNIGCLLLLSFSVSGQRVRCASDINITQNQELHDIINSKIEEVSTAKFRKSAILNDVLKIPVVVHVVHNNASGRVGGVDNSNISEEQIHSQIEVLNEDYRRRSGTLGYNSNPVGTDMQIEFFLANIDPNGLPSTGINRVYTQRRSFNIFTETRTISDLSYWDSNRYLNIWVTTISNGYLGYAEFPIGNFDGLETVDIDERIDGVFVDFRAFGRKIGATEDPYSHGRTTTHEIGHWLGLIHTWGDVRCGTDFCEDTPPAEAANNTLVCTPVFSNCRGVRTQNMIENYMDYTVDSCMNTFTQDQSNRVRAILEISKRRKTLLANALIFEPSTEPLILRVLGNPVESNYLNFQVLVDAPKDFTVEVIDNLGRVVYKKEFENSVSKYIQIPKTELGTGFLNLYVSSGKTKLTHRVISL